MEHTLTTRTITEATVVLSEQDLEQLRTSPWDFGEALKERLGLNGTPVSEMGKQAAAHGPAPKLGRKAARGKAPAGKRARSFICPDCDQKFTSVGFLNRHQVKTHGLPASADAAE